MNPPDAPGTGLPQASPVTAAGPLTWAGSPSEPDSGENHYSPFVELERDTWARLANEMEQPFDQDDLDRLRGIGENLSLREVAEVYLPLSRLLSINVDAAAHLRRASNEFLGESTRRTPFVIGVAAGRLADWMKASPRHILGACLQVPSPTGCQTAPRGSTTSKVSTAH